MNTFIFTPSRPCVKALLTGVALLLALVFMASCNGGAQPPAEISTQGEQTTAAIETTQPPATQGQGAQTTTTTELPKTQLPATQSRGTQTTTTTAAPKTQPPDALQYPDLPQLTVYQLHTVASRVLPPVQAIQGTTSWTWASGQSVLFDSAHPLQLKRSAFDAATLHDPEIYLSFSWPPEEVTVRRWPAENPLLEQYETIALREAPNNQLAFTQMKGDYIYEVSAKWAGTNQSSYAFRVTTYQ